MDTKFLFVTQASSEFEVSASQIPSPDEAVNEVLRRLLSSKHLEAQGSIKIKEQAGTIIRVLNMKDIDITQL